MQEAERRRLSRARRPDEGAITSPGSTSNDRSCTAGRCAVVREAHVLEPYGRRRARPRSRARGEVGDRRHRVDEVEELPDLGRLREEEAREAHDLVEPADEQRREAREGHDLAHADASVSAQVGAHQKDAEDGDRRRGSRCDRDHRPPGEHRDLRREEAPDRPLQAAHLGLDAREALHDREVPERVRNLLRELRVELLDGVLQALGPPHHEGGQHPERRHEPGAAGGPSRS